MLTLDPLQELLCMYNMTAVKYFNRAVIKCQFIKHRVQILSITQVCTTAV